MNSKFSKYVGQKINKLFIKHIFKDKYRDFDEQINLGDLSIDITKFGKYTKIELCAYKDNK